MRGGSVRLTQAVRLAACGKEPEEKLSERKRQTADKSDLFILAQKTERAKERPQTERTEMARKNNLTEEHSKKKKSSSSFYEGENGGKERQMSTGIITVWPMKGTNRTANRQISSKLQKPNKSGEKTEEGNERSVRKRETAVNRNSSLSYFL